MESGPLFELRSQILQIIIFGTCYNCSSSQLAISSIPPVRSVAEYMMLLTRVYLVDGSFRESDCC